MHIVQARGYPGHFSDRALSTVKRAAHFFLEYGTSITDIATKYFQFGEDVVTFYCISQFAIKD